MRKIEQNETVVNIITATIPNWHLSRLAYNDYNSPFIKRVRPAVREGDKYHDLLTGAPITLSDNDYVWDLGVGDVLQYPDGRQYLINRKAMPTRDVILQRNDEGNWKYRPSCMVLHVVTG